MKVELPHHNGLFQGAVKVVRVLREAGYEAFIVGGAVRDLVLCKTPWEYDITTSARPSEVMTLFHRTIPVGMKFGVVIVRMSGEEYEVATYREDLGYSDGRHPDGVRFTDLRSDVMRRDFTMNGMAVDPETGEIIDYVDGIKDIERGLIRAIGDPSDRFTEDHLRPLRAIRFSARTGFSIDDGTMEALVRHAPNVATVSRERIADEMRKMLLAERPDTGYRLLVQTGILDVILPGSVPANPEVTSAVLGRIASKPLHVMWGALLFQTMDPSSAETALRGLKYANQLTLDVKETIGCAIDFEHFPSGDVARDKRLLRRDRARDGLDLLLAVRLVLGLDDSPVVSARKALEQYGPDDLFPPRYADGNDAVRLGIPRGPAVAKALHDLEDATLRGDVSSLSEALEFLRELTHRVD